MTAGDRLRKWLDETAGGFADRLTGWVATSVKRGMETSMDFLEPELRDEVKPSLLRIRDIPGVPDDLKSMIDKTVEEPKAIHLLAILPFLAGILIGFGMQTAAPLARVSSYMLDKMVHSARIDPMSVITAWRRDPEKYTKLFDDLKDMGWSDERIEALKFTTLVVPPTPDWVRFARRDIFAPEVVDFYDYMGNYPEEQEADVAKVGLRPEYWKMEWMAHWRDIEWSIANLLLHRGKITPEQHGMILRTANYPPGILKWMTECSWDLPNRIETRMMARYGLVDKPWLIGHLERIGLHEDYRSIAADFMLAMGIRLDVSARYSKGWITKEEVKTEIDAFGMSEDINVRLYRWIVKNVVDERVTGERDLTKTDIIKGVKKNVIVRDQAVELLVDMGYDTEEADYILAINIPVDEEDGVVSQRELTKADILKGLKAEVITRDEARGRLLDLRFRPSDAEFLLKIFDAQVKPPVEPREREASKADILLGVKKGLITPEEGYAMLLDLDFTPEAADFILMIKAGESPFSPINYAEFKDLTRKYRVATGREEKPMPEEIKTAAAEVVRLTGERDALTRSIEEEQRGLVKQEVIPEETTKRLKSLQVKRNRAESKLSVAKSEYDRLVAEWKYAAGK